MNKEELKVGDLVPLKESVYKNTLSVVTELLTLVQRYQEQDNDPFELENIKKEFIGHLFTFSGYFSQLKCYKGGTHTYLDEVRKRIKAESLEQLISEGTKVTAAGDLVYGTEYYKSRVKLMEDIKSFMIKMDLYQELFQMTFQAIIQSLSNARKEYENSKHS